MAIWTPEEDQIFFSLLVDGVSLDSLIRAFPKRSVAAIRTRARLAKLDLDFHLSKDDGCFYRGVKRREHKPKEVEVNPEITTNDSDLTSITLNSLSDSSSAIIIAKNAKDTDDRGLKAYTIAHSMFIDNNLRLKHDLVYQVSCIILDEINSQSSSA